MRRHRTVDARDAKQLRALIHAIRHVDIGREPVLDQIKDPLRDLLRAEIANSYAVTATDDGPRCSFVYSHLPRNLRAEMDRSMAATRGIRWASYDLLAPEREQRNHARAFSVADVTGFRQLPVLQKFGVVMPQLRILVCEGANLLAWVGAFRSEAFTARERGLLQKLAASLRGRLQLEARLSSSDLAVRALDVAMELIAGEAYLVGTSGKLLHVNAAARARLDSDGADAMQHLADAVRHGAPGHDVHRTRGAALVIAKPTSSMLARVQRAIRHWRLTRAQGYVLAGLARGYTNSRIAVELNISARTVEDHVAAIMRRADCASRAPLIAATLR